MAIPKLSFKGLSGKEIAADQNDPKWEPVFRWLMIVLAVSLVLGFGLPLVFTAKENDIGAEDFKELNEQVGGPHIDLIIDYITDIILFSLIVPTVLYAVLHTGKHIYYLIQDVKLRKDPNLVRRKDYRGVALMLKELGVIRISREKNIILSPNYDPKILPPVGRHFIEYIFGKKKVKEKVTLDSFVLKSQEATEEIIGDSNPHISLIRNMFPENKSDIQQANFKPSTKTFLRHFWTVDRKHSRFNPVKGLLLRTLNIIVRIFGMFDPKLHRR